MVIDSWFGRKLVVIYKPPAGSQITRTPVKHPYPWRAPPPEWGGALEGLSALDKVHWWAVPSQEYGISNQELQLWGGRVGKNI